MRDIGSNGLFIRNVIFGVEDSLVSTVGLLSGIAAEGTSRSFILLTGIVYIAVEAFSMAVGSFLSEEFTEEYVAGKEVSASESLWGGLIMFISFVVAGFVPIIPYILVLDRSAILYSVIASVAALFVLGMVGGRVSHTKVWSRGLRMALLGGFAILVGILVASFVKIS
jgi:VIT1/CCC1 family predicted Fe2+/Mn2+ transporter